jgi:dienelactone hydrolase
VGFAAGLLLCACGDSDGNSDPLEGPDSGPIEPNPADAGENPVPPDADEGVDLGDPDECVTEVVPGENVFDCGGISFDLTVPESCATTRCGLIVDVHGGTMTGRMEDNNTNMRALGQAAGYIVIQPNANGSPPFSSFVESDDDLVIEFVGRVMNIWDVDPNRVHLMGFSQGGFMTWRIYCKAGDLFASVAPAGAADMSLCENANPLVDFIPPPSACVLSEAGSLPAGVDILVMHGTADPFATPDCVDAQVADAATALGMSGPEAIGGDDTYRHTRYTRDDGTVLEVLSHDYASSAFLLEGHCYPGSTDPGDEPGQLFPFGCAPPNSFNWGEAALEFFLAHPRN